LLPLRPGSRRRGEFGEQKNEEWRAKDEEERAQEENTAFGKVNSDLAAEYFHSKSRLEQTGHQQGELTI
jgi:hypothetical protein